MKFPALVFLLINALGVTEALYAADMLVNQVGYLPAWPKIALLVNAKPSSDPVQLINATDKKAVFVIQASPAQKDGQSGDTLQTVDFSSFHETGQYLLKAGETESAVFTISNDVYQLPLKLLLRSYYLQRCAVSIDDAPTGLKHAACHTHDALIKHDDNFHKAGDSVASTGGWHDAGDYGKYVATTAVSVGRILAVYEAFPDTLAGLELNIPQSGDPLPDVLAEMKVGLDWLLTMQRADGALYRKLSGETWSKGLLPHEDSQPRYIYGVTTPETAKAAGAWAMAARIYQHLLPQDAAIYKAAALKAWQYLQTVPSQQFEFQEGDNKGSGPYMYNKTDNDAALLYDWDDRLWAAAELLITTGDDTYRQYLNKTLPNAPLTPFEWKDPSSMAWQHILFHPNLVGSGAWQEQAKTKVLQRAKLIMGNISNSGYHLANARFVWSSNKLTIEEGVILLYAYRLTAENKYLNAAIEQLDYIFGRNHFNQSFVSGIGTKSVSHVSHLYLSAAQMQLAGLLVGGPNELEQSGIAPRNLGPLSYIDDTKSYATNEYAIDLNAALIGLMSLLLATPYPSH